MENAADFRLRKSRTAFSAELKRARSSRSAHADEQPEVAKNSGGPKPARTSRNTRSIKRSAVRVEEKDSDQERAKHDHSIERRPGVDFRHVLAEGSANQWLEFLNQVDEDRSLVADDGRRFRRHDGRRQDGLATSFRANARFAQGSAVAAHTPAAAIGIVVRISLGNGVVRFAARRMATA